MDESSSGGAVVGVVLGVVLVAGLFVAVFAWQSDRIRTASLDLTPPLLFVPK